MVTLRQLLKSLPAALIGLLILGWIATFFGEYAVIQLFGAGQVVFGAGHSTFGFGYYELTPLGTTWLAVEMAIESRHFKELSWDSFRFYGETGRRGLVICV